MCHPSNKNEAALIKKRYVKEIINMSLLKWVFAVEASILIAGSAAAIEPAQEQEIETLLSKWMNQVRQRVPDEASRIVRDLGPKYGAKLFPYLETYMTDPERRVRWRAYSSLKLLALDVSDVEARQGVVLKLLRRFYEDEYYGNCQFLGGRLQQFTAADFSEEAKELLVSLFRGPLSTRRPKVCSMGDIVLLVGVADIKSELTELKKIAVRDEGERKVDYEKSAKIYRERLAVLRERAEARRDRHGNIPAQLLYGIKSYEKMLERQYWQSSLMWSALRARARMGIREDIQRCIELVESHPDEDYRVAWLLDQLSYVRRPEVVSYLQTYLNSDKLERYKGADTIRLSHGQRAGMALAKMLRGFPGKKDSGVNKEGMKRCRKWMTEQKESDIIR